MNPSTQNRNTRSLSTQSASAKSASRSSPVRMAVETLELRVLLAGNVLATVVDGNLTIAGDTAANTVTLNQTGLRAHQMRILSSSVNGTAGSVIVNGVKGDVLIRMDAGIDSVTLRDVNLPQSLGVSQGARDTLTLDNVSVARNVTLRNSSSALPINTTIGDTTVGQNLNIITGDGGQLITIDDVEVKGTTNIVTGRRYDVLTINDSIFRGNAAINTGRGDDVVMLETDGTTIVPQTRFETGATILLGGENDKLEMGATAEPGNRPWFEGATRIDGGTGTTDTVHRWNAHFKTKPNIAGFELINPSVDSTAPTVVSTDAEAGDTGVARNRTVAATFSEVMDGSTFTATTFTLKGPGNTAIDGEVTYVGTTATFTPDSDLAANTLYTATITTGVKDAAGNALVSSKVWTFTTGATADSVAPTTTLTSPTNLATNVVLNKTSAATFSESMNPLTFTGSTFTVTGPGNSVVAGTVNYDAPSKIGYFTPSANLAPNTLYTATIKGGSTGVKDLAGNALAVDKVWTFTTGTQVAQTTVDLGDASTFAVMATSAISGTGSIQINGDVGLSPGTAQGIPPNQVNGTIHVNDQAIVDAQAALLAAYDDAVSRSTTPQALAGNMGGLTFTPGLYTNSTSVLISGAGSSNNVTLDAQGDPNAIFIFKMGSTLTTGSGSQVILAGGAKAGNVFWQVGSSATLNTTSIFKGNILAAVTITVNNGSAVEGRLLAGANSDGGVTVNGSTITLPIA